MDAQAIFDELSREAFRSRLPRCEVSTTRAPIISREGHELRGYWQSGRRILVADDHASRRELEKTLLHEVCHVIAGAEHGTAFQSALCRLALSAGAAWVKPGAVEEILA